VRKRIVSLRVDDQIVCERCVVADRPWGRMRGLLGRSELPRGEGILLRPAGSVHTFFMRFPIDVVFLNRDDVVVEVASDLRPWRAAGFKGARSAIELAAGEAEARGLVVGKKVALGDERQGPEPLALRQAAQTMAEYAVVLTVISAAVVLAGALMSNAVVAVVERVVSAMS
jgi:uncharacterized membrane protein (UPF0127 family)